MPDQSDTGSDPRARYDYSPDTSLYDSSISIETLSGQIKIHPDNERHTALKAPLGTFNYTIASIRLSKTFPWLSHRTVRSYVNNITGRNRRRSNHTQVLRRLFDLMMLQFKESLPRVSSNKSLGFIFAKKKGCLSPQNL